MENNNTKPTKYLVSFTSIDYVSIEVEASDQHEAEEIAKAELENVDTNTIDFGVWEFADIEQVKQ